MGVKQNFIMDSKLVKIKDALNDDFLNLEIYSISEGENVNGFSFTYESMKKSLPTFFNKFILGFFTQRFSQDGNFEEHNADLKYDYELSEEYFSFIGKNAERAIGLIRESDTVEIVKKNKKRWIRVTAAILTKYNREIVKYLLKNTKQKISVEITILESHKENGIEVIDSFVLDGITILGYYEGTTIPCEEGIEGAHLTITDFMETEDFKNQKKFLEKAYLSIGEDSEENSEEENENNERKAEITFNKKEGDEKNMSYMQKRNALENALGTLYREHHKDDEEKQYYCPWVNDFTDDYIIASLCGEYYKINYIMLTKDEETIITFDFENKVKMEEVFVEKKDEVVLIGETTYTLAALKENFVSKVKENETLIAEKTDLENTIVQLKQVSFVKEDESKEDEHHEDESKEDEHHEDESKEDKNEDEHHEDKNDDEHHEDKNDDEHHEDEHHEDKNEDEHHEDESKEDKNEDEHHEDKNDDEHHEDEHHEDKNDDEFNKLKYDFECTKEELSKRLVEFETEKQNYLGRNQVLEAELKAQKESFIKVKNQLLQEHGENFIRREETLTEKEVDFVKNGLNVKINDGSLENDKAVEEYVNTEVAKIFYSHAKQGHDTSFSFSRVSLPKFSEYEMGKDHEKDNKIEEAKKYINILNNN